VDSDDDVLVFVAVDASGRACPALPAAVLSRACAQRLVGPHRDVAGIVLDPVAVLAALDGFVPTDRDARDEYSAILVLALVAEVRGVLVACDGEDPRTWTPARHPDYRAAEVQAALAVISEQLGCSADDAAHRLFAVVQEAGASLRETSRDVVAGRLSFTGNRTLPGVGTRAPEGSGR
jgi:hypothetical protein